MNFGGILCLQQPVHVLFGIMKVFLKYRYIFSVFIIHINDRKDHYKTYKRDSPVIKNHCKYGSEGSNELPCDLWQAVFKKDHVFLGEI